MEAIVSYIKSPIPYVVVNENYAKVEITLIKLNKLISNLNLIISIVG